MIALARKYRPKQFADLLVQDHVAVALRGAVAQRRVAHGYLFAGPRGVGKTTAARILAMALNCERPGTAAPGEPCGVCDSCTRIWNGAANLDVVELDAASNRGVDDARDLRERAMYAASTEARSKVYIVDEAHMLTREAWNALLKILEEPPPRVVFVFATTEPQRIAQSAAPILSRLQRFDFRRIGPQAILDRLEQVIRAEGLTADADALRLIARRADGALRDALSLVDQVLSFGDGPITAARVRDVLGLIADELYGEMLRLVAERDAAAVFPLVDRLVDAGADLGEFVSGSGEVLRAVLLLGLGGTPAGFTESMDALIRRVAPSLPPADVIRLLALLGEVGEQLKTGGNTRLIVELLLLRWAMMSRTVELEAVIRALGKGEGGSGKGGVPPATPESTAPASAVPVPLPPSPFPQSGPLTLERMRGLWSQIVADARAKSPLLGTLVAASEPFRADGQSFTIRLREPNSVHAEGLERQRDVLGQIVGRYVTEPVRVVLATPSASEVSSAAVARAPRLTEEGDRAERLSRLRARDARLDAAAEAFDLELLE